MTPVADAPAAAPRGPLRDGHAPVLLGQGSGAGVGRARMGGVRTRRYDGGVGRYFTPRCIGMHVTLLVLLPAFAWLTWWQLSRALGGNTLSWAYTFEWPLFAGYAIYVWWQLIHDQTTAVTRRVLPGRRARDGAGRRPRPAGLGAHRRPAEERGHRRPFGRRRRHGQGPRRAVRRPDARGGRPAGRLQPVPGRAERRRRRLPRRDDRSRPPDGRTDRDRRWPRPVSDGRMHGALIRYRVMAFIVGTALLILSSSWSSSRCSGPTSNGGRGDRGPDPRLPLPRVPGHRGRPGPPGPLEAGSDPRRGGRRLRAHPGLHRRAPGLPADAGGVGRRGGRQADVAGRRAVGGASTPDRGAGPP